MKKGTTYILLERGTEDVELLAELRDITPVMGDKVFAKNYPHILELKQLLEKEKGKG